MSQFNFPSSNLSQAFDALITLSSGSSEPPSTAPYMLWMDTSKTPAVLRQRNADDTEWIDLFASMANSGTPVGTVNASASTKVPDGWLKCDGAEISRTEYADLFDSIGATFGEGDKTTTFNLPDLRGEFIRGVDDGRGVDTDRVMGSEQGDAIRNINGRWFNAASAAAMTSPENSGAMFGGESWAYKYGGDAKTTPQFIEFDASRVVPTAEENRPRNVALMYVIKY